jgi:hypothetical protein
MKNKFTMIYGLSLYGLYIVAYPIAAIDERYALLLVLVGGFAGGIAAGFIWTAHGAYFAQTSQLYAKLSGITQEESSNKVYLPFLTSQSYGKIRKLYFYLFCFLPIF